MRNSDLTARIAMAIELLSVLWNLVLTLMWFFSLIWVLIGLFWGLVGVAVLVQAGVCIYVLVRGYTPVAFVAPIIGLVASMTNFNVCGGVLEVLVLMLVVVGLVLRSQEDQALAS